MQQIRDALPPPLDARALAQRGLPGPVADCLQAALAGQALPALAAPWQYRASPAGGQVLWEARGHMPPRRWATWSRGGRLTMLLHWAPDEAGGGLLRADVACPDGRWAQLLAGGAAHPLWGDSDRLCFGPPSGPAAGAVLLPAQDYAALGHIPPVDQPARLPRGVGSAVLNLLATLMVDQGLSATGYRGPYPTPALFDALCGCFAPDGDPTAARETFTRHAVTIAFSGELVDSPLRWRPQPWEAVHEQDGVWLHWRGGPQALWLGQQAFLRCAPRPPLPVGRRLWPVAEADGAGYHAGLILLGQPYSRHADLDADGRPTALTPPPAPQTAPARPLASALSAAILAWAKVSGTAALAPALEDLAGEWHLAWADLGAELALAQAPRLLLHGGMVEQFRRLAAQGAAAPLAMMLFSDACQAAAPLLAGLAQQRLLAVRSPPDPNALMQAGRQIQARAQAELAAALPALVAALAQGEGLEEA